MDSLIAETSPGGRGMVRSGMTGAWLLKAAALIALSCSTDVRAETQVIGRIDLIQQYETHGGILVKMAVPMPDPEGCGRTDWYILPDTANRMAFAQSMLLTAKSSGSSAWIVIGGCFQGFPKILHITM
jgi:hypothetical protein